MIYHFPFEGSHSIIMSSPGENTSILEFFNIVSIISLLSQVKIFREYISCIKIINYIIFKL